MSKIQNKAYLNNLHNTSFPKSPKTLNLDKPNKSYKRYNIQGSKRNARDLIKIKGPICDALKDPIVVNRKIYRALTTARG